ncbi:hypothetical protein PVAND_007114 [Polypedilum vanderplanki]|uniref:CHHC U11-48K-type domain-containing protein n=1 Tax=Polypedilum vanderplanki TaxID=319348 RepID=A0A9J6C608_POLVA|nr:hypothetical protein PVAND_007114 [Polypedilum vanderplanki]
MEDDKEMVVCPYNESHIILRARLPFHLLKCQKTYMGKKMIKCPYNAMHIFENSSLLRKHIELGECEDFKFNYDHSFNCK